jgi:hypothetical protein
MTSDQTVVLSPDRSLEGGSNPWQATRGPPGAPIYGGKYAIDPPHVAVIGNVDK